MKWKSSKGTVIDIPDGLTAKQIAAIKADANAGYGTRAQKTATDLGKKVAATPAAPKSVDDQIKRTQDEIAKRTKAGQTATPNLTARLQMLQGQQNTTPTGTTTTDTTGQTTGTTGTQTATDITKSTDLGGIVDSKTGTVDPNAAGAAIKSAENQDITANFNLAHPGTITDQYGNQRSTTRDPVTGQVTVTDQAGGAATTFKNQATAAAQSFNGAADRTRAEDATYNTLTKYYDRDQQREMESQKQELAQRGIPYDPAAAQDPNSKNLYGRTIGGISEKFRGLKDNAAQQAILSGNQTYATDASVRDSFINAAAQGANTFGGQFGQYQNNQTTDSSADDKDILAMSAQQYAQSRGLTLAEAQSKRDDATRRAAIAKSGSGGSSSNSNSGGGFEVVG